METISSKRSYALTWCMPNNNDDDDDDDDDDDVMHCSVLMWKCCSAFMTQIFFLFLLL